MRVVCLDIMWPTIAAMYRWNDPARCLQASTLDQPRLVDAYLPHVRWTDVSRRLLRLCDNIGLQVGVTAFVDGELAAMSEGIRDDISAYAMRHELVARFGRVFDTTRYILEA